MKNQAAALLGVILLMGCAAKPANISTSAPNLRANQALSGQELALGALMDTEIPKGECGMMLWTLDAERPILVFRFVANGHGEVMLDGVAMDLTLTQAEGASGFGIYENFEFQAPDETIFKVSVRFGQGFDRGSYLQQGLITVERSDGWKSVTPTAGIAGCRS